MTLPATANKRTIGTWIRWIVLPLLLGGTTIALIFQTDTKEWEIDASVSFINLAEDLLAVNPQTRFVRLRIAAKSSVFESFGPAQATCRFDLAGLGEGKHSLAVQSADISLPKGVSLIAPMTSTLTIQLEKKMDKTVDILPELKGELAPGFAVAAVRLEPDRIRLTGTAAMLEGLNTVKTHPISLAGASESFKKEIPLNLAETIIADPPSRIVVAEIDIRERLITRRLENIPITPKGRTSGYRIDPTGITLAISGPEAIVSKIESNPAFSVTIDLEGLVSGVHTLKAAIKLPLHTTLVQVTPELFTVTIGK